MNIIEQMREYILNAEEPPLYRQMKKDLGLDDETAKIYFMRLFRENFCKAMSIEGELRIFMVVTKGRSNDEAGN